MNMESVLNRLRDTVSATVYQVTTNLNTALPGNPLTREYELIRQVGSAGPGLIFKIYEAVKKSTKENAALFILEKKLLDEKKCSKKVKESFLEAIRRGVAQLARLRHPSMLTVQHNMEESRDLIAFATEPVIGSLLNVLENTKSLSTASEVESDSDKCPFYDIEIKYGLLQVSEGLVFLHRDAKILHRNLCPENIIINRNGIWKISGFDFSVSAVSVHEQPYKYSPLRVVVDQTLETQANFTYSAPEHLRVDQTTVDASADIFSLGMLAYTLYNRGTTLCPFTSSSLYNVNKYLSELENKLSSSSCLLPIPEDFRKHMKLLISFDASLRPDAQQISKLQLFQDVLVRTLQYFDSLFQWDNAQKAQFYKNLPEILPRMPKRVKLRRIVSGLAKEFVNPEMVPFVLPNMIEIAKESNDEEFHTWIVPELVPVFKYKEPIQIGIYLLQNMDLLVLKFKTKPDSLREHIIPLIYRFLESDAFQIQELCLSVVPTVIHLIDYSGTKNMLLPRIKKLALHTKLLSVRVNCLICLGKILEQLDKWLVLDEVLTLVMQMPSREPAVIMASVGILKLILNSNKLGLTKEISANKVLPFLIPLSIENGLSLQQYNTVMLLIREMISKVEEEHTAKLRQLDSVKVQQDTFFSNTNNNNHNSTSSGLNFFQMDDLSASVPQIGNTNESSSLSLDDKERLAFQKEQQRRLDNEKPLVPQTLNNIVAGETAYKSQTKDLTSTLINANLNILSTSSHSKENMAKYNNLGSQSFNQLDQLANNRNVATINPPTTKPNISSLDKLVFSDLGFKSSSSQSLNALKNASNHQQPTMIATTSSMFGGGGGGNMVNNSNFISTNQTTQPQKQLSKSELEEFLK